MELRYLRYFIAIAEELSFSRAAERLNMSQPPLSQQIQRMEEEIGVQLLYRTKRTVRLTEAGQAFLEKAYQAVARVEDAINAAQRAGRGETGSITIGFVPSASFDFLPIVIQAFRERFPDVELELRDMTTSEQIDAFNQGKIDIGFVRPPFQNDTLTRHVVIREPFIVVLPEEHALAHYEKIPVSALAGESFIMASHALAPGLSQQTFGICSREGFSPNITQEVGQLAVIISFVAAKLGIAIQPQSIAMLQHRGVVYRPLENVPDQAEVLAVWKPESISTVLRNFIETVCATAELYRQKSKVTK
ncbi:MAG: LysR substrate-binding domain-containing protein [Rectinemataceae bacterium]|nr:LysR substrate-binding domain-containing protein [Rectinemataceae bacterium]